MARAPRPAEIGGFRIAFREQHGERVCVAEPADRPPRAQILLVHGLSDHLGRQLRLARWLARRGYRAVGFDLQGHGGQASPWSESFWVTEAYLTTEAAGDTLRRLERAPARVGAASLARRQYEALSRSHVDDHLDQLCRVLDLTRELDPGLPLVLIGHSMGALLCLEAVWRHARPSRWALRGVGLLSPALEPQARPGRALERRLVESVWAGRRLPFSWSRAVVKTTLDLNLPVDTTWGNRWVSDLPDEVALFAADPLVPRRLPTRYLSSVESLMATADARAPRLPVPALLLLPERDGITSVAAGLAFARAVGLASGGERLRVRQFAGLGAHDLLRSSQRHHALAELADWLDRVVARPPGQGEIATPV